MKVLCLGGAGRISRESVKDLAETSNFEEITIGDFSEEAGQEVAKWINDPRVKFIKVDVNNQYETVELMKNYDIVMDGTAITLNDKSTACIAKAGVHGINLNGLSTEWSYDEDFKKIGKICVPGFGMTPGITNMMAKYAADQLDTVDAVRISHGAYRPIAFSKSIAETTTVEYDPNLESRVVFEDGELIQVPPFARPRMIELPEPYGANYQYIIPHIETMTLSKSLADKGVRLIEVRGTWPQKNMQLIRALYDWGFLRNDKVKVNGAEIRIMDAIAAYWLQSPEGQTTELYGYSLHVEVTGTKDGKDIKHVLIHTHPASDGSVKDWEGLRAYTRCVGIPLSIGAQLIAAGKVKGAGTLSPELAFDPAEVFKELEKRDIMIHEQINAEWTVNKKI